MCITASPIQCRKSQNEPLGKFKQTWPFFPFWRKKSSEAFSCLISVTSRRWTFVIFPLGRSFSSKVEAKKIATSRFSATAARPSCQGIHFMVHKWYTFETDKDDKFKKCSFSVKWTARCKLKREPKLQKKVGKMVYLFGSILYFLLALIAYMTKGPWLDCPMSIASGPHFVGFQAWGPGATFMQNVTQPLNVW